MTVTREQISHAASILAEGAATHAQTPSYDPSPLDLLGMEINLTDLIPNKAIPQAIDYLVGRLPAFQEIMDSLKGNPDAIRSCANEVKKAGESAGTGCLDAFKSGVGTARSNWTGEAANEFGSTAQALATTVENYAKVPGTIADMEAVVAANVGAVRGLIRDAVSEMINSIVDAFAVALPASLLAGAGGGIAGGSKGLASGITEGWSSGSGFWGKLGGAITGGGKGMISGAVNGAKDAFIESALASVVAWANAFSADYLQHFSKVLQELVGTCTTAMGHVRGLGQAMFRADELLHGNPDPGTGVGVTPGSFADSMGGSQPHAQDIVLAQVLESFPSNGNKAVVSTDPPVNYERLSDEEIKQLGIDPALLTDDNGFLAGIFAMRNDKGEYVDAQGNPVSSPQLAVAMGGTTEGDQHRSGIDEDWIEDGVGAVTMSQQSANAIALSDAIKASGHGDDTVYTGHSLGGRLASVAAMHTGSNAVTFNAAGVSDPTYDMIAAERGMTTEQLKADSMNHIRTYSTSDDPLTWAQQHAGWGVDAAVHDAAGTQYHMEGTVGPGLGGLPLNGAGHTTANVIQAMGSDPELLKQHPEWADYSASQK